LPLVARHATWWNCPSYGIDRLAELRPRVGDVRISAQHPIGLVQSAAEREDVKAQTERRFGAWGGLRVGDADELTEALGQEVELGVEMFILQFHDYGSPETLEAFARSVMPAVQNAASKGS
jgi:alkanesulfonate monooxygenase SsuD/methylene tetrahydromethanopterin reductase-like flavin-dependent oxidoreductase (luciferase family)